MNPVTNNEAKHRFEADVNGEMAVLEYRMRHGALWLLHTDVPAAGQGGGVGAALVRAAMDYAREQGIKVVPACTFAAAYIRRHPEYESQVEWPD